jgi:TusA-related sulfurtransferase
MTQLDLRGTPCPINFVRTKMKLEQMPVGDVLEVWLDAGEPIEQVPDSLKMAGYTIDKIIASQSAPEENRQEYFILQVHK